MPASILPVNVELKSNVIARVARRERDLDVPVWCLPGIEHDERDDAVVTDHAMIEPRQYHASVAACTTVEARREAVCLCHATDLAVLRSRSRNAVAQACGVLPASAANILS